MKKNIRKSKGFTLIELIVVIGIIAILATVTTMTLSKWFVNARNSTRMSGLQQLSSVLEISMSASESLPMPDNYIEIKSGTGVISYQGVAGNGVLEGLESLKRISVDPLDKEFYVYSINANKNRYQVLGFMEGEENKTISFAGNYVYAADYSTRYPKTEGDSIGILLDNKTNAPITTSIDVETYTGTELKAIITNAEKIIGTGSELTILNTISQENEGSKYPGCDTKDIRVGKYLVAACNAGATKAWTNETFDGTDWNQVRSWAGGLYQWGNNADVSSAKISTEKVTNCTTQSTFNSSVFIVDAYGGDNGWCSTPNPDAWGDITNTDIARRGPCNGGYHVPSSGEWNSIISVLGWIGTTNMSNKLKMPLAGNRGDEYSNAVKLLEQGFYGSYWSSSYDSRDFGYISYRAYRMGMFGIDAGDTYKVSGKSQNNGYSVRCIKN